MQKRAVVTPRALRHQELLCLVYFISLSTSFRELRFGHFADAVAADLAVALDCPRLCFQSGLRGSQTSDRHSERRTTDIGEAQLIAELHAVRIATVLTADPELYIRAGAAALLHRDLHQLAHASLINRGERILLNDFQFLVRRQEGTGVVSAHA